MDEDSPSQIPVPHLDAGWQNDRISGFEERYWPEYDEISQAKRNNTLIVHKTIRLLIPVGLTAAFFGFLALCGVYLWHLIARHDLRRLEPDELQNIHSMIFSSVVGGAIAILAKTYFNAPTDKS